jgi:hypothetical protein
VILRDDSQGEPLNFRKRWASALTILIVVGSVLISFGLRNQIVNATRPLEDSAFGISARLPAGWLVTQGSPNFVFRAQDALAIPFKTAIQLTIIPIGQGGLPADVINDLLVNRAAQFTTFKQLGRTPITLRNGTQGQEVTYAYAAVESNPFLQSEPIIVRAVDVVVLRQGQAIIITYETDTSSFEKNKHYFDAFLASLEF